MKRFFEKVRRRLLRLRLQPIRVFCFHQVSDEFEPDTMKQCDWIQTDVFKKCILKLKRRYIFISLPEATAHLQHDRFRRKRYAVLTADDGWASMKNILPWLAEQGIPLTLFLNPSYLNGKHFREKTTEKYLTINEIGFFVESHGALTVASHGWGHCDATRFSEAEFQQDIAETMEALRVFSCFILYHAYTWGRHNAVTDGVLKDYHLIPVLMDGQGNYNDPYVIHREMLME